MIIPHQIGLLDSVISSTQIETLCHSWNTMVVFHTEVLWESRSTSESQAFLHLSCRNGRPCGCWHGTIWYKMMCTRLSNAPYNVFTVFHNDGRITTSVGWRLIGACWYRESPVRNGMKIIDEEYVCPTRSRVVWVLDHKYVGLFCFLRDRRPTFARESVRSYYPSLEYGKLPVFVNHIQ